MDFPPQFSKQLYGLDDFVGLVAKGQDALLEHFAQHPEAARTVLNQSYDKRWTPSTFMQEKDGSFVVGWFDRSPAQCIRTFSTITEAATDYLLFSFGKGRLKVEHEASQQDTSSDGLRPPLS